MPRSKTKMEVGPQTNLSSSADIAAFRGVIDAVPHPIFVKDEGTRFLVVNQMMCDFMNCTYDELIGKVDHDFIPLAEKLGLISQLTFDLLRTACLDAKRWPDQLVLALNLSPAQLTDSMLPMQVLGVLSEAGFPPNRLEIEITEGALVRDLQVAKSILTSFQNLGMKISLDNFGGGYSNMYHLPELRFDKVKIDRSFIQSLRGNPESVTIVNAILDLSKRLGLPALAHRVGDADAVTRLIEGGGEFGQGHVFGKAVTASEAADIIARSTGALDEAYAIVA